MVNDQNQSAVTKKKAPALFYIILFLIPFLFFATIEFGLRQSGYGKDYEFFTKLKGYNQQMIYVNTDMSYKYFGNLKSSVFTSGIGFLEEKPDDCFRIFVLGGSSTQGFPYNFNRNTSFPAHLKQRLDKIYPNTTIEVINLGASAINSYTILDVLPSVLDQLPDLILIYTGHNEYYGALGAGSSKSMNPTLARTILYLRDYRIVQLMENSLINLRKQGQKNNSSLMQRMIGESSIAIGSDTYNKGLIQFEKNLSSILQKIKKANVPVLIGTLSSNIGDQKPFDATQEIETMTSSDHYELGRQLMLSNDSISAKSHLIKAKQLDGLRFRAPEEMNVIIREKATEYQVPLVDIDSIFSVNSPMNITGENLMCDHLHPNMAGYFLMSKSYYQGMQANGHLPEGSIHNHYPRESKLDSLLLSKLPYSSYDSISDQRILFTGLGSYPFIPLGEKNPYQEELDKDELGFGSISREDRDSIRMIIASQFLSKGDSNRFAKEMSVFISSLPSNEYLFLKSIRYLSANENFHEAHPIIIAQLKGLKETNISKNKMIGKTYMQLKAYDSASMYLEKALQLWSNDTTLLLDLGFIHLELDDYAKAEKDFTRVIDLFPENKEAYHQRAVSRFELTDYAGTVEDMTKVITLTESPEILPFLIRGYAHFGLRDKSAYCNDWAVASDLGSPGAQKLQLKYCSKN